MFHPITSRLALVVVSLITSTLFLSNCASTTNSSSPDVAQHQIEFAQYDQPLRQQIVDHIEDKVMGRLGTGKITHDRFFIIPFAYEKRGNDPEFSHSFMSVIRVFADGSPAKLSPGLKLRSLKGREFEAFTISWLPHDFSENPHLCVFEGFGGVLIPEWNQCQPVPGKSFDLPATLKLAADGHEAVGMWGPYEITKPGFDLTVKRLDLLNGGTIQYKADDRITRKPPHPTAINCFHAMASVYDPFPNGGIFGTGFKMWGLNGTKRVLLEYTTRATDRGLLLEPVDIDKDVIGFVYAPQRKDEGVYDPFENRAFAYHK
jgi:hypothetical protein